MKKALVVSAGLLAATLGATAQQVLKVDPAIPAYQKASGVSGNISSIGSDTMNNLMTLWAETFRKFYPNVRIQVEGKGSSTAPAALIAGTAQFGPMSRSMRSTEIDQFQQRYGYKPTEIRTSYDALAVYVHRDNPIKQLTLAQVDAIFGKSKRRGYKQNITTWGQLGLTGDWANRPIGLYGRNSASGTYGYFKEHALRNGDFKDTVKEQPGSASVVQGVTEDRYAIGYSGIGYRTSGVRPVPLAETEAGPYFEGTYEEVTSGKYPLARFLFVYVNKVPGKPMDPLALEYMKLVLSKEGQEGVVKDGYMPLTATQVQQELGKLSGAPAGSK
jgi:phosphate transport system substrate-binding protein